jgi:hypothetical protein
MTNQSLYYLSRVIKLGQLTSTKLIDTLTNPSSVIIRNVGWTIIETKRYNRFVVGIMVKYDPEGEISIIDNRSHSEIVEKHQNMRSARSPFIYIPEYSALVYQKVSGEIEPFVFSKRFAAIIKETFKEFFMDCDVEPITDLRSFSVKLASLDGIHRIQAKVNPPNPLFGPYWGPLKDYLKKRKTETLKIEEEAKPEQLISSRIPEYVNTLSNNETDEPSEELIKSIDIGDAAILMAADGYGEGLIQGKQKGKYVTIKTSESIHNFTFDKIPNPEELYKIAVEILQRINTQRHMKHDEE